MELLWEYVRTVLSLFAESAPWLLVGFFLAGLLRLLVPERRVYRYLGGNDFRSVLLASLFGIPLPLCSCSVLPTASHLRKSGASKGATTSYLISTPETGADSIGLTWALLDPIMTVMRPLAALLTALVTGSLVNKLVRAAGEDDEPAPEEEAEREPPPPRPRRSLPGLIREANAYAFGPLLDDLTPWFVLGFLLSGAVALAIPDGFFATSFPTGFAACLLMLFVGLPIYICAAAATPLAAALIVKGLSPGAALVLLLVGPATNVTTVLVVSRLLGKRVMAVYLIGVAGCALLLGSLVDAIYADQGIDLAKIVAGTMRSGRSPVEIAAVLVFFVLLGRSILRIRLLSRWRERLRGLRGAIGFDPTGRPARIGAAILLAVLYLSSCFSVVGPGEVGFLVRFGRVVREVRAPGLVVHLPMPFESLTRLRTNEVRGVALGFSREEDLPGEPPGAGEVDVAAPDPAAEDALLLEAQVMTGEENLLRITFGVQFDVKDAYAWRYRVADPVGVVRAFAESAVREAVAPEATPDILVGHRRELEEKTRKILQRGLDRVRAGILVTAVTWRDVHAPREVHFAYRDVASSLEDKEKEVRLAEAFQTETLADARAKSYEQGTEAESYAAKKVGAAKGEAQAFLSRLMAYRTNEELTRLRMYFEAAEAALREARAILLLGPDVEVDLWNVKPTVLTLMPDAEDR